MMCPPRNATLSQKRPYLGEYQGTMMVDKALDKAFPMMIFFSHFFGGESGMYPAVVCVLQLLCIHIMTQR